MDPSILSRVIFAFAKSLLIISNVLFNRTERRTFYKITETQIRVYIHNNKLKSRSF